jgi:hypothetical protein
MFIGYCPCKAVSTDLFASIYIQEILNGDEWKKVCFCFGHCRQESKKKILYFGIAAYSVIKLLKSSHSLLKKALRV